MSEEWQTGRLLRRVMWQRLDIAGTEICSLASTEAEVLTWLIAHVQVALDGVPREYRYIVGCDAAWRTTEVSVVPSDAKGLRLRVEHGRWILSGAEWNEGEDAFAKHDVPAIAGCIDVDLSISPSTNTLPIRRLNLAVGESRELTAAWVRFPELTLEPLAQRYTRLAERRYRYESITSGFTAELEVDELGLVVDYEGIWKRVAEGDGKSRV